MFALIWLIASTIIGLIFALAVLNLVKDTLAEDETNWLNIAIIFAVIVAVISAFPFLLILLLFPGFRKELRKAIKSFNRLMQDDEEGDSSTKTDESN